MADVSLPCSTQYLIDRTSPIVTPPNTRHYTDAGLMLGQRRRRCPNINPVLVPRSATRPPASTTRWTNHIILSWGITTQNYCLACFDEMYIIMTVILKLSWYLPLLLYTLSLLVRVISSWNAIVESLKLDTLDVCGAHYKRIVSYWCMLSVSLGEPIVCIAGFWTCLTLKSRWKINDLFLLVVPMMIINE